MLRTMDSGGPTTISFAPQINSNLPTNMYDRPAIIVQQAMRGKLGKSLEALFKPENMTPADMQGLTNRFLSRGKPINPITQTLIDVATNPFMWIGLAMWAGPYWKAGTGKFLKEATGVKAIQNMLNGVGAEFRKEGKGGWFTSPQTFFKELNGQAVEMKRKGIVTKGKYYDELVNGIGANTNIVREETERVADALVKDRSLLMGGKALDKTEEALMAFHMQESNLRSGDSAKGYVSRLNEFFKGAAGTDFAMQDMSLAQLESIMNKKNPNLVNLSKRYTSAIDELNGIITDAVAIKDDAGKYIYEMAGNHKVVKLDIDLKNAMIKSLIDTGILPTLEPGGSQALFPRILQNMTLDSTAEGVLLKKETPESFTNMLKGGMKRKRAVDLTREMPLMDLDMTKTLIEEGVLPQEMGTAIDKFQEVRATKVYRALHEATDKLADVQSGALEARLLQSEKFIELEDKINQLKLEYEGIAGLGNKKQENKLTRMIQSLVNTRDKEFGIANELGDVFEEVGLQKGSDAYKEMMRSTEKHINSVLSGTGNDIEMARKMLDPHFEGVARQLSIPHTYNMNPDIAVELYSKALQPVVGTLKEGNIIGLEQLIAKNYDVGSEKYNVWFDEVFPMMKGRMHPKEAIRRSKWRNSLFEMQKFLGSETGNTLFDRIPGGQQLKTNLINNLKDPESAWSRGALSDAASQYFHLSTLGANLGAVSKNLMQVPVTVGPVTGSQAMLKALGKTMKQVVQFRTEYSALRKANPAANPDLIKSTAFKKVFPDFNEAFGPQGVVDAMVSGDMTREGQMAVQMAKSGWSKIKKAIMTPFGVSEQFNRIWAFNSFSEAATKAKMPVQDILRVAAEGTKMTQFTGGIMGQPNMIRGMPSMARQYMHFPMRFMEWMKWTTGLTAEPGGITLQPLGKAIMGTTAAYETMKNLFDIDISPGLMFQAMPLPQYENSPFYPFPLVPPAAAAVGYGATAVAQGTTQDMGKLASLFVPGGIAGRRLYRTLSPKFADYKNVTVDGKIPVYNANKSLLSYQSPGQLIKRSLGIHSAQVEQEYQAVKYLTAQRDKIRGYRKQYIEAMLLNDHMKMSEINAQHKKDFPEIGNLQINQNDLKNYKKYQTMTRLQRALKQMPSEYKGIYEEALMQGSAIQMGKMENVPGGIQQEYARMAANNSPYPMSLLD